MKDSLSYQSYIGSPYKSIKHSTYFEVYDELFARFRDRDITFVEVGVLAGGSLFMWRDFFGPRARIIGVDLNPNARKWERDGFEIHIGNQSDRSFWADFIAKVGTVDIVLDDGGHTYEQQIVTTEMLLGNINCGGLLVVEDTHTSYMDDFGPRKYSFMTYVAHQADRINRRSSAITGPGKADDRIWSIRIFESIVAFEVNRPAVALRSETTTNNGADDGAADYRHRDIAPDASPDRPSRPLGFLGQLPGARRTRANLAKWLRNHTFKHKGYFE